MQRSMSMVICEGRAMAIQRRHQAAARRAAEAGCSRTLTTGSRIPGMEKKKVKHMYVFIM